MAEKLRLARKFVFYLVSWIEFLISIVAVLGIISHLFGIGPFWDLYRMESLSDFMKFLFDALISIEFVKLLCRNDLYSMIEVLLFTVTRHLVIQHLTMLEILFGIAAIGILFAVRKYLFIHPETYEKMQKRREYID